MVLTGQPIRVVYAKLTATGAYDVVAKTSNVALERARTLAERLLPGNPPLDAVVGEEVAHARHWEGGHIVLRFARYDWTDGERGDVYITDIVWLSDEDFRGARNNAFALVPRTDRVFETLTELPPFTVPERSAADDLERVAALRDVAHEAKTLIASATAADPVLVVHAGNRVRAMELFTLLLPPGLRARLTFQTQAFRVPATLPRVTLVDRAYSNLRDAAWRILPSVDVDVPLELAGRLVALADEPESLGLAHDLYDDAYREAADLRTSIMRLTRLAAVADALRRRDAPRVLRLLAAADHPERAAGLRRLRDTVDARAWRDALVQLQQEGGADPQDVLSLLRDIDRDAASAETTAALVDALPADASDELVVELASRAAQQGDLSRLILLLVRDPRTVATRLRPGEDFAGDDVVRQLLHAIRAAYGPRHDLDVAARLLEAAQAVRPSLSAAAAAALHRMCRAAVVEALERTHATTAAVTGMLRLQDAADDYVSAAGSSASLPSLLARRELATGDAVGTAARFAADYPEPTRAVMGATLLTRAWDAHRGRDEAQRQRATQCAVALLTRADSAGRELARRVLAERNVQEHELVVMPGAETLLPILGGNAQQAAILGRIVSAIDALAGPEEEDRKRGLQELAGAVFAAHVQRIRITPRSDMSQQVVGALRALAPQRPARGGAAAAEICLELLGVITDPAHMQTLEDAALGTAMAIRLQRLDRSVAHCRAAEDEERYERYALALESADMPVDGAARDRLRDALGTHGLKRRLLRVVSSVIERDAS
jgi:hypothetical protein